MEVRFRVVLLSEVDVFLERIDASGTDGSLVIATHGIVKKSNKTPQKDIQKAQQIRNSYFDNSQNQ